MAGQLCCTGLWVGGHWCSTRGYVIVPPKKKKPGWVQVVGKVMEGVEKMEHRALGKVERIVGRDKHEKVVELIKGTKMKVHK